MSLLIPVYSDSYFRIFKYIQLNWNTESACPTDDNYDHEKFTPTGFSWREAKGWPTGPVRLC